LSRPTAAKLNQKAAGIIFPRFFFFFFAVLSGQFTLEKLHMARRQENIEDNLRLLIVHWICAN